MFDEENNFDVESAQSHNLMDEENLNTSPKTKEVNISPYDSIEEETNHNLDLPPQSETDFNDNLGQTEIPLDLLRRKVPTLLKTVRNMYNTDSSRNKKRLEQIKKRKDILDNEDETMIGFINFDMNNSGNNRDNSSHNNSRNNFYPKVFYEEDKDQSTNQSNSIQSESIEGYTEAEVIISDLECEIEDEESIKDSLNNLNTNNKSFIPINNTLRIKRMDKDKATASYLMALQEDPGTNNNKQTNNYCVNDVIQEEESENNSDQERQTIVESYMGSPTSLCKSKIISDFPKLKAKHHKNSHSEYLISNIHNILSDLSQSIQLKFKQEKVEKENKIREVKSCLLSKFISHTSKSHSFNFNTVGVKDSLGSLTPWNNTEEVQDDPKFDHEEGLFASQNNSLIEIKESEEVNLEQELNNQLKENELLHEDVPVVKRKSATKFEISNPITFDILNTCEAGHYNTSNYFTHNMNSNSISVIPNRNITRGKNHSITYDIRKKGKVNSFNGITRTHEEHRRSNSTSKKIFHSDVKVKPKPNATVKISINYKSYTSDLKQYLTYTRECNRNEAISSLSNPNFNLANKKSTCSNKEEIKDIMKILHFPFSSLDHQKISLDRLNTSKAKFFCLLVSKDFNGKGYEFKGIYEMNMDRNCLTKLYTIYNYQNTVELNQVKTFYTFDPSSNSLVSVPEVKRLSEDILGFYFQYSYKRFLKG